MNDREIGVRQLSMLGVLDDANTANARFALIAGICFGLLGLVVPVLGIVSGGVPIWVMAIMFVCGGLLGAGGLFLSNLLQRAGSDVLAHLRASPEDPIVASQCQVVVRNGARTAHFAVTTRSGKSFTVLANGAYETKVGAALDRKSVV